MGEAVAALVTVSPGDGIMITRPRATIEAIVALIRPISVTVCTMASVTATRAATQLLASPGIASRAQRRSALMRPTKRNKGAGKRSMRKKIESEIDRTDSDGCVIIKIITSRREGEKSTKWQIQERILIPATTMTNISDGRDGLKETFEIMGCIGLTLPSGQSMAASCPI